MTNLLGFFFVCLFYFFLLKPCLHGNLPPPLQRANTMVHRSKSAVWTACYKSPLITPVRSAASTLVTTPPVSPPSCTAARQWRASERRDKRTTLNWLGVRYSVPLWSHGLPESDRCPHMEKKSQIPLCCYFRRGRRQLHWQWWDYLPIQFPRKLAVDGHHLARLSSKYTQLVSLCACVGGGGWFYAHSLRVNVSFQSCNILWENRSLARLHHNLAVSRHQSVQNIR